MQFTIIIWTLICATAIIGYPIFLYNKGAKSNYLPNHHDKLLLDSIILLGIDLKNRPPGWSFTLEIPELTEDILFSHTVLFYLETEETCLKLPINNETLGYSANIFKNVGKAYLTFKCVKDGVSNFTAPMCHLKSLKVLIVKQEIQPSNNFSVYSSEKYSLLYMLRATGVNIHQYEETLEYLSNFCEIDYRGYRKNCVLSPSENQSEATISKQISHYSSHSI